jgi:hypothetical protein
MVVKVRLKSTIGKNSLNVVLKFIKFLNSELPLKHKITVEMTDTKTEDITTGSRSPRCIKVLCGGRMLIDILRTTAHEWVHEYQHQQEGLSNDAQIPDVGGWAEDEANAISGALLKKFEYRHKDLDNILF